MVKTRHSLEPDEDPPDVLLSLTDTSTRRLRHGNNQEYDNEENNVSFGRSTRRRTTNPPPDVLIEDVDEKPVRRQTRRKTSHLLEDEEGMEEKQYRRSCRSTRGQNTHFLGDYGDDGMRRRSSRKKNLVYNTFNQNLITANSFLSSRDTFGDEDNEKPSPEADEQPKKRRKTADTTIQDENDQDNLDMYTRVKRVRQKIKRDMYGMPIPAPEMIQEESSEDSGEDSSDDESSEEEEQETKKGRSYNLREYKPRTQIYEAPVEEKRKRVPKFRDVTPPRSPVRRRRRKSYKSPVHPSPRMRRRRAAFHGSDSTSSSSSSSSGGDSSDDERRFERRKAKSMAKSRQRCLPMNFGPDDIAAGVLRDRAKIGTSLADVDPMTIDRSVNFNSVGGLGKHIRSLKEMIVFPLLYPEVFDRFKITPPRGVLFYGPPGTGKTLVARALANECSHGERRVAFFMRKGADCLSKWVGESERQLRLLFDQAYQMRPSIIFFDEIDGLAPVRSSRQDQIHSSIVSTLLALMDGLDSRGEIVVIGATNRIDSIDPALRRPGRFDREFHFPLPSAEARAQIVKIQTKDWNPQLAEPFVKELAEHCVGYCGADVRALCTEAALIALRRRYPQIYTTQEKLQLDVTSIQVIAKDFHNAMQNIVPAAQRAEHPSGRGLSPVVRPLLQNLFDKAMDKLNIIFPLVLAKLSSLDAPVDSSGSSPNSQLDEMCSDEDDNAPCIYAEMTKTNRGGRRRLQTETAPPQGPFLNFNSAAYQRPATHRPRLLLSGHHGQGQSSHLAPALIHGMERLPVHVLDLPSLFAVSAKTPEESCAQVFREARRTSPSIVYVPHIDQWWEVIHDTLRATFLTMLQDLEPASPLLLLATSEQPHHKLPTQVQLLFSSHSGQVLEMHNPTAEERTNFFQDLLLTQAAKPPTRKVQAAIRALEVLPKAPPPEPRKMTDTELKRLLATEEQTLRELRLFLRDVLNKLSRDRKFQIFTKPVDEEDVEDYYEIITNPMDLGTMMKRIDLHQYQTVTEFLKDIDLICSNALEYNPEKDTAGRAIRHRACALRDTAHAVVDTELDKEFEEACQEIKNSRQRRGVDGTVTAPSFYHTKPLTANSGPSTSGTKPNTAAHKFPEEYPTRFSRRVRGMIADDDVEHSAKEEDGNQSNIKSTPAPVESSTPATGSSAEKINTPTVKAPGATPVSRKSSSKKSIWCRPSRRRRFRNNRKIVSGASNEDVVVHDDIETVDIEEDDEHDEDLDENKENELDNIDTVNSQVVEKNDTSEVEMQDENTNDGHRDGDGNQDGKIESETKTPTVSHPLNVNDDSGIGSAQDSNGAASAAGDLPGKSTTEANTTEKEVEESEIPQVRMTRSKMQNSTTTKAIEILEETLPPFIIDKDRLQYLLALTVERTHNYTVEKLESIHSQLSQCIYHHRRDYDKTVLLQDLELVLQRATANHTMQTTIY